MLWLVKQLKHGQLTVTIITSIVMRGLPLDILLGKVHKMQRNVQSQSNIYALKKNNIELSQT